MLRLAITSFVARIEIAKFKICKIKKYSVLAEIAKFNACQIFPLYSTQNITC